MLAHSSGTMLMDGHRAPMTARSPRPTASRPLLLQTTPPTKLLPVVQLRSGVILLMGDTGNLPSSSGTARFFLFTFTFSLLPLSFLTCLTPHLLPFTFHPLLLTPYPSRYGSARPPLVKTPAKSHRIRRNSGQARSGWGERKRDGVSRSQNVRVPSVLFHDARARSTIMIFSLTRSRTRATITIFRLLAFNEEVARRLLALETQYCEEAIPWLGEWSQNIHQNT